MKVFCEECLSKESKIIEKKETLPVKGENIEVLSKIRVCTHCGEEIFDEELDEINLENAYQLYKQKHGLLTSNAIKELREKYGISQRLFSRLLGWGEITMHRYESGAIQDQTHNNMLILLKDPNNMKEILEKNREKVKPSQYKKIIGGIEELLNKDTEESLESNIESMINRRKIDVFCGYQRFEYERLINLILYFTEQMKVYKTKLMKLLFYADFLSFKRRSVSITGLSYVKNYYGPTPEKYDLLIGEMVQKYIDMIPEGSIEMQGEYIKALEEYDLSIFEKEEREIIEDVSKFFKDFTSREISEYSHKEAAWLEPNMKEKISYEYAKELLLS